MTVFIHDDMHFASIAYSLPYFKHTEHPVHDFLPQKLANLLKQENIRSFNFLHGKRNRITPCVTVNKTNLSMSDFMRAIISYEDQASAREDFGKSEAAKLIHYFYTEMPKLSAGYQEADITSVTVADVLVSFAQHNDGDGMEAWHWDKEFGVFERSEIVRPGRVKPWPWLIRTLTGESKTKLSYEDAVLHEPVKIVKFLLEHKDFPDDVEAAKIHDALLRHHVRRLYEVYGLPPKNIMSASV